MGLRIAGNATLLGKFFNIKTCTGTMSVAMNYARETSGLLINRLRGFVLHGQSSWLSLKTPFNFCYTYDRRIDKTA